MKQKLLEISRLIDDSKYELSMGNMTEQDDKAYDLINQASKEIKNLILSYDGNKERLNTQSANENV